MNKYSTPEPEKIRLLFENIAPRYDLLNDILSFGLNRRWRAQAVKASIRSNDAYLLDLGTGSGKLLQAFLKRHAFKEAIGVDFCQSLLDRARKDLARYPEASFLQADIFKADLPKDHFDIIASAFVVRSLGERLPELFECTLSLLNSGGRLVILELTRPKNALVRTVFLPYLTRYLPWLGAKLTGNPEAYNFLKHSILNFKSSEELADMIKKAGFSEVKTKPLNRGIVTLFIASR